MNKIYKVIWSKVKHQYVVTSEFAHSCTKSTTSRVGKSAVAALAAFVLTAGVGGMSVQANDTTSVNQEMLLAMQLSSSKDKNDVTVVPAVLDEQIGSTQTSKKEQIVAQESVQNDEGFYVRNGDKGTYNSLTKDGLWVGGTSNTTGFHVDNDGNIHTTGNAEVDGAFNAANGNVTIDADGTTYVHAGQSELQVTDNQAVLRHGNNGVIVNNDGVSVAGDVTADNSVKVGLVGYDSDNNFAPIYGTEIGADGSFSTAQGSFSVDKDGNVWAANGDVTIDADGTTYVHAGQSELQITDNQAVLRHGNNGVIVNNDGVSVAGDLAANNGLKVGVAAYDSDGNGIYNFEVGEDGSLSAAQGNFTVDADGTTYAHAGQSELQVTDNQAVLRHGNNGVIVNNDGVSVVGDLNMEGELNTGDLSADTLSVAEGKFTVDKDGTTYAHVGQSELQVTDNQAVLRHGNNSVIVNNDGVALTGNVTADDSIKVGLVGYDEDNNFAPIYGTEIDKNGIKTSTIVVGGETGVKIADGKITGLKAVEDDMTAAATVGQVNAMQTEYKDAGITASTVDENATGAIAMGEGARVVNDAGLPLDNAIAVGTNAVAGRNNAVAIGLNSNAAGENSLALGYGAKTTANGGWNSVALGYGSEATEPWVVSVGSANDQRRIVNVADGTNATDAATVGQMNKLIFGSHSGSSTSLSLVNTGTSLVDGINKNTSAINALSNEIFGVDYDFSVVGTNLTTMQAKMANFESVLSKLDVDALSEVSTMSLTPSEVEGSREPSEGGSTGGSETQTGENASYSGNVSVGKDLTVNGNSTFKGTATFEQGADMNGQKITNVGDGAVEAGSKDAVNGGQLYNVQQDVQANSSAINSLGSRVSDLGDEIDSVGAISAALAGLHPLDYDGTGSKFQISAAMGTYDGTQAAAIGGFYHFNRDVMLSLGGATSFEGDKKTAANIGVTFRVGEGASGKSVSDDVMARLEAMDRKITALEQENKDLKNVLGAIDTSLSKEFPDVPANHWAYEAVTKLAGNDVVAGYPDGEFHGDRTMTRYEMAEIIYKAMNRGVQVDQKLVEEFKPEMEQVAANQNA